MIRKIIKIDGDKCNGCGLCVSACHEGAIGLVDGKAELLRDDYCDGLGNCLPVCPTGAISFEERDALEYDEAAVLKNMEEKNTEEKNTEEKNMEEKNTEEKNMEEKNTEEKNTEEKNAETLPCGCPGTNAKAIARESEPRTETGHEAEYRAGAAASQLAQWPVQIKLVPVKAPYFNGANLLVSADCAAYAYGGFHNEFMKNRVTLIGCPKLDDCDYSDKLADIIQMNDIKSVMVVRMEVPCCGGIENAVKEALKRSGKMIPWQIVTISTDGKLLI